MDFGDDEQCTSINETDSVSHLLDKFGKLYLWIEGNFFQCCHGRESGVPI